MNLVPTLMKFGIIIEVEIRATVSLFFIIPIWFLRISGFLHSDATGETSEPRWQMILHERNNATRDMDRTKVNDAFGGRSDDFFNNPR